MSRLSLFICAGLVFAAPGGGARGADQPPRVLQADGKDLARVKRAAAAGDKDVAAALRGLRAQADRELKAGPFTVTRRKPVAPPSGDPHDYVSLAPYWWPDPAKKDGRPYVRRDGRTNPERDKYDLPQLSGMAEAVETLALAYYFTGEERYAAHAAKLLRAWFLDKATRMNPNLKYAQFVPGRNDGRGTGIIETRRFLPVLDAVALLEGSSHWSKADRAGLEAWFRAYLRWLETSKGGKEEAAAKNNHGTWYDAQVVTFALFVGDREKAKAVLQGSKKRVASQVEPDGSQPRELKRTKSFGYTVFNLRAMFALATLGEQVGVDLWRYQTEDGRGPRKALDYVVPYATGAKEWKYPQLGKWSPAGVAVLLRRAANAYGDRRYEEALARLPAQDRAGHELALLYPRR
jgi:hypothetical protein